jgi:hypothetical protein
MHGRKVAELKGDSVDLLAGAVLVDRAGTVVMLIRTGETKRRRGIVTSKFTSKCTAAQVIGNVRTDTVHAGLEGSHGRGVRGGTGRGALLRRRDLLGGAVENHTQALGRTKRRGAAVRACC